MKQVFLLTVVLIGVVAAMFVLRRKADEAAPSAGTARPPAEARAPVAPPAAAGDGGPAPMRVVALTRFLPRYKVAVPAAEPDALRPILVQALEKHGGKVLGALPAAPRAAFPAEVPHGAFKKLLKDLGLGTRPVLITADGEAPHAGGPARILLELSLPAPSASAPAK